MAMASSMPSHLPPSKGEPLYFVLEVRLIADHPTCRSSALRVWREMPYDVVTTGNHELYRSETAKMTKELVADHYGDRYVTSNVELNGTGPLGQRVRKFKTLQGRNVTAFGILFNFRGTSHRILAWHQADPPFTAHAPDIQVQAPSDMVKDKWFLDAIQERPDFFLLGSCTLSERPLLTNATIVGHMSIRLGDSEWTQVVQAIRKLHPSTPVLIFGGHHHVRPHLLAKHTFSDGAADSRLRSRGQVQHVFGQRALHGDCRLHE